MTYNKTKHSSDYTYDVLFELYGVLIGEAVVIQPVANDHYDIIDVAYDMYAHWYKQCAYPMPRVKCLTRRNLTIAECIQYAEECIKEVRKPLRFVYYQVDNYQKSGAVESSMTDGTAKKKVSKIGSA